MAARGLRLIGSRVVGLCRRTSTPLLAEFLSTQPNALSASLDGGLRKGAITPAFWQNTSGMLMRGLSSASLPHSTDMEMPALSPTMSQGNIAEWKKKEGDRIEPGDAIAEIETDKATITWEAQEEGYLAKILMPEGSRDVSVGTVVAVMVDEESDVAAFAKYPPGGAASSAPPTPPPPTQPQAPEPTTASSSSANFPTHLPLEFPALSPTMSVGNIVQWNLKEGDEVTAGDSLCTVETDKSTLEWESQDEGFLAKILVPDGTKDLEVGTPVAILVDDKELVSAFKDFTVVDIGSAARTAAPASPSPPAPSAPAAAPLAPPIPPPSAPRVVQSGARVMASPYAKKLANEAGVSLQGVGGTGAGGRIVAADVAQLISSGRAAPVSTGQPYIDAPVSQIRRITADRLLLSKQTIPHYYLTVECNVDNLVSLRKQLNGVLESKGAGIKLSVNDFIIKAAGLALKSVPEVNSSWQGDFIRQYNNVDISIAVQTPHGLMVPIVKNADGKGLEDISTDVKALAAKAKEGALKPEEFMGGTFTISNLGMYGIRNFSAIINPPQACILAVGAAYPKVVAREGSFKESTAMQCTMSCDHRVVDGAVGAQWLNAFRGYIEQPLTMML